jgi:hypothetical protein
MTKCGPLDVERNCGVRRCSVSVVCVPFDFRLDSASSQQRSSSDAASRNPYALAAYADLHASLGNLDEARAYLDRALANQSSPAQHALLKRKRAALDETHAVGVFGSDRPGGTPELRARLECYWTRTLDSLKARLENAAEERDSD